MPEADSVMSRPTGYVGPVRPTGYGFEADWLSCEEFSCACEDASDRGPTRLIGPNKVIELS